MGKALYGGCACGSVRYRLEDGAYDAGWCHCRLCQRTTGAPAAVFTASRFDAFRIMAGDDAIAAIRLTEFGERRFCRHCGTLLTIRVDFQPDEIGVAAATLDDPEAAPPGYHIFTADAISWAPIDDGLPRHAGWRPDTRGRGPNA